MKGPKRKYSQGFLSLDNEGVYFASCCQNDHAIRVKLLATSNRTSTLFILLLTIISSMLLLKFIPALLAIPILLFGLPITYALSKSKFTNHKDQVIEIPMEKIKSLSLKGNILILCIKMSTMHFIVESPKDLRVLAHFLHDSNLISK